MYPSQIKSREELQTRNLDITVLSICDTLDALGLDNLDYMAGGKVLMAWCQEHGVHYYAQPREDFFIGAAVTEAEERGLKYVVVEDMS